jgi:putative transposase
MKRAYLYRLYPTTEQAAEIQRQLDVARELYNACLEECREAYKATGKSLTYYDQANQIKAIRQDRPDMASVNYSLLQAVCRRAQRAFDAFFRRVKAGQKPGYPRFKSYHRFHSITFPAYGDGCKLTGKRLYVQGIGAVKVKLHRAVQGAVKTVTLKRSCGKWYVVLTCEVEVQPLPATGASLGLDVGLTHFLITDSGETVGNPRPLRLAQARLRRAQRSLARKTRGSRRRRKQRQRVATQYQKVANVRRDFHHKTAHTLVHRYDTIYHEDLAVSNMMRNHSLARSISDAA